MPSLPPANEDVDLNTEEGPFSWPNQVRQYPTHGSPGIAFDPCTFPDDHPFAGAQVWTLLYRNRKGRVVGILNYYPQDFPPFEKAGNVNVRVHPRRQRRGIGSALVREAHARGWPLDPYRQRYTTAGRHLAERLLPELPAQADR